MDIKTICDDLYQGVNYPGKWHGYDTWGKFADFHEHSYFIWETIQKLFFKDGQSIKPLNIFETGRCTGQSTNLFSAISQMTEGQFFSFDIADWNRRHILKINEKYGVHSNYQYIVDSSLNAVKYFPQDIKFDIVFLDSLHSYELVKGETLLIEKYLNDNALILFHDTVWCFDSVMGWIKDYLQDKNVVYAKHTDTHKPQCQYCEDFNKPHLPHGRPVMQNGRPNFQSPYDLLEQSPHFNILNDSFITWSNKKFEDVCQKYEYVFTNIEAGCGIGALVKNKL